MKQFLFLIILGWSSFLFAQQEFKDPTKWRAHVSISQNPAVLVVPNFKPVHPGFQIGTSYQWNGHQKHRFIQTINGGFVYHKHVQKAIQLQTEIGYELKLKRFSIVPLAIGGGYVFSISDLSTLKWNSTNAEYETVKTSIRHNWLISLGPSLSYDTQLPIFERPLSVFLDYRLQVQGIFINESSPFIAYTPIRIGVSVPFSKTNEAKQ